MLYVIFSHSSRNSTEGYLRFPFHVADTSPRMVSDPREATFFETMPEAEDARRRWGGGLVSCASTRWC